MILLLMYQNISVLVLFVNCSAVGRLNNKETLTLCNMTEHEKKWLEDLYCNAYSFKKKLQLHTG